MARRFKRRKPRVAWFPTFGGAPVPEGTSAPFPGVAAELELDGFVNSTDVVFDAQALTFDEGQGSVEAQADPTKRTLHDIITGNEWRLRRLVGKCFIWTSSANRGATVSPALDVAVGFIVCKTYDDGFPLTDFSEVNPLSQESMEDPWIWRRRWLLHPYGEIGSRAIVDQGNSDRRDSPEWWGFPASNVSYGSVADGPHVDAKSQRVIHRSERLFVVLAARRLYNGGAVAIQDTRVDMLLDYRILGSLKGSSYGNRGNTSR